MRTIYPSLLSMVAALVLLASCLGDDDDNLTYYDDTAITSFTLGTLNRTMHTLSSEGEDSTYTDEVDGSEYNFFIDQATCEIYNPDSLPEGTDNSKVVCTIYSKNSGVVVFKDIDSDTLTYYDSSDSLDFSEPREVRVYSLSGYYYRTYTISVNVHQQDSTELNWALQTTNTSAFGTMEHIRSYVIGDNIYVFGTDGSQTSAFYASTSAPGTWTEASLDTRISGDADAYANVVVKDGYLYVLCSDGSLLRSSDADTWEYISSAPMERLIAYGGEDYLYGMSADSIMISADNGVSWTTDAHDDDVDYLPTECTYCFMFDSSTNDDVARVVIVGNRDADTYPSDTAAVSWGKIEEYDERADAHSWIYQDGSDYWESALPRMEDLTVVAYNDGLLAMGGNGIGSSVDAYTYMYTSYDQGLSWHIESFFVFPDDFDDSASCITAAADSDKYLYIICGGTGQVWRGRLNKYAWEEYETTFTE